MWKSRVIVFLHSNKLPGISPFVTIFVARDSKSNRPLMHLQVLYLFPALPCITLYKPLYVKLLERRETVARVFAVAEQITALALKWFSENSEPPIIVETFLQTDMSSVVTVPAVCFKITEKLCGGAGFITLLWFSATAYGEEL